VTRTTPDPHSIKRGTDPNTSRARDPRVAPRGCSAAAVAGSAASLQARGSRVRFLSGSGEQKVAITCADIVADRLSGAGDEARGRRSHLAHAPRPQALRRNRAGTRTGSMTDWVPEGDCTRPETPGNHQPRDSHVHG